MPTKTRKTKIKYVPESFFHDKVTTGVARGVLRHFRYNRFTLVNLPVGYGKTLIAVMTAVGIAKSNEGIAQIGVIAPKAKRLDKSFDFALRSAEKYFNVKFKTLLINGEETGTFSGLSRVNKSKQALKDLEDAIIATPTMFILDETHMSIRDSTSQASKIFSKVLAHVEKAGAYVKVIGLTATPFDKSILDAIGYLVFNGNYNSRTAFYRSEILNYDNIKRRGATQDDIEAMILRYNFTINKAMFADIHGVINQLRGIIYSPEAPRDFHIPENKIMQVRVPLSDDAKSNLKYLRKLDADDAFPDPTTKRIKFIEAMTTDSEMVKITLRIVTSSKVRQPLIFYQYDVQRDAIIKALEDSKITFVEVNGKSHSYFDSSTTKIMPVLCQYASASTAFEAKLSDTTIYFGLPDSSINFDQSLGRNARRGQEMETIMNYVLTPIDASGKPVAQFQKQWSRIQNKMTQNAKFLQAFRTKWGTYEDAPKRKA